MKPILSIPNPVLDPLTILVGQWKIVGKHPLVPNVKVEGGVTFEWIEGGAFLRMSSEVDHPQFPTGIAIIGSDADSGQLSMLYFDERKVSRNYNFSFQGNQWKWWREDPKLAQRFTVTIADDKNTMSSKGEMQRDGGGWQPDLSLLYTRISNGTHTSTDMRG